MLFVEYPKCSTCKKAKKWLTEQGVSFAERHIVEQTPTAAELKEWQGKSGLPLKRFFNTSGMIYRELNLKERLQTMSEEEQLTLLSSDGMLIKRPILVTEKGAAAGFREAEWEKLI